MELSKIETTLKYGRFFFGKRISVLYVCFAVSLLMPIITLLIGVTVFAGGMIWSNDMLGGLIGGNTFSLLLFSVILWAIIKNNKVKREVKVWLEDAQELKSMVKRLDIVSLEYKPYQVQVEFIVDNVKHYKVSSPGNHITGYHKIFAKYDKKTISILYSPKYDEVLILKDNKH